MPQTHEEERTARSRLVVVGAITSTTILLVVGVGLYLADPSVPLAPSSWGFRGYAGVVSLPFVAVGALIVMRRPRHPIGWMLTLAGAASSVQFAAEQYVLWGTGVQAGEAVGLAWAAWFYEWTWVPLLSVVAGFLPLIYPTGRLLGPRWRPVGWVLAATSVALVAAEALDAAPFDNLLLIDNPAGIVALPEAAELAVMVGWIVPMIAAVGALFVRTRRATGVERLQMIWLLAVLAPAVLLIPPGGILVETSYASWGKFAQNASLVLVAMIPVAVGIAILRYQLFDIELVVNRALVVTGLVGFVTIVYAAVVGGIGALVGERAGLWTSVAATGLVAVGFHPVRMRLQHLANRMVYGQRATPYEVLSTFANRLEGSLGTDELLVRLSELIAQGTGAVQVRVWLRVGELLRPIAASAEGGPPEPVALVGAPLLPALPDADHAAAVVHRGDLLGAVTIAKPRGEPVSPTDQKLVDGLAAQAGLLLRNQRLTAELVDLVDQLRASRQRLVAAQDEERRRLERDLHDGAQQQIIALKLTATAARTLLDRGDAGRASELLERLVVDTDDAVASLRELAHGIYPPLLAAEGLGPAIRSRAAKLPMAVHVSADGGRFSEEVEAAVYFCVLEALQNVTKYANATNVTVQVAPDPDGLRFIVSDDGHGFDPSGTAHGRGLANMTDRVEALGGRLSIRSTPGEGTRIEASIPRSAGGGQRVEAMTSFPD